MNFSCFFSAEVQGALCNRTGMPRFFSALLLFALVIQTLHGQSTIHWTDLDSFKLGYEFENLPDTLPPLSSLQVKMHFEADPGVDVSGVKFEVGFNPGVLPLSFNILPDSSWLGKKKDLTLSHQFDIDSLKANWNLNRKSGGATADSGWVLTTKFLVLGDPILKEAVVNHIGGLIFLDNVDMKRELSPPGPGSPDPDKSLQPEDSPLIFPNPFSESFQIKGMGQAQVRLLSLQGRVIWEGRCQGSQVIPAQGLSQGAYLLEINQLETGKKIMQKLIKQ